MSIKTGAAYDFLDGLEPPKKSRKRKIKYWPNRHEVCRNCGCDSDRRDYGGNGYCCRCYRLTRRLEKVKGWDQSYREILKREYDFTDEEYKVWQDECIRQLKGHLAWLQGREDRYRGEVEGIVIEYQLARILQLIRPEANYPMCTAIIDRSFTKKQLGLIYRLLDVIEEAVPWEGPGRYRTIDHRKAWRKIWEHRTQSDPLAPELR